MPSGPQVQRMKDRRLRALARFLDRVRHDSQLRRKVFLGATGAAVAVITTITAILTLLALTSSAHTADRLAAAGDVLVGATLLLAAIAALVALLAYAVSTGAPDIQLSVQFDRSTPNNPAFEADIEGGGALKAKTFTRNLGKVLLRNNSGYSAKNPAVIVRLHGMFFSSSDPPSFEKEWASMEIADTRRSTGHPRPGRRLVRRYRRGADPGPRHRHAGHRPWRHGRQLPRPLLGQRQVRGRRRRGRDADAGLHRRN